MQPILNLLVCLHRHESTAQTAEHQLSPCEKSALQTQLALLRDTVPHYVLDHYDQIKQHNPMSKECPAVLAMATLVSVYRALPARKRWAMTSFFDLAGYSPRR